ncbi:mannose-6-phosphate isomerase, class I [Listeria sp. PSOL-1]|uniref:mannose-6-phosphate isomerase, class I n=1 Tax=Listeria sp. PSOL-1 TaxID=1844999 RepID=UPI0013D6221F|nr:mannose-6-phosphate isomerase, class I [Listeria sp. PSOL-1]
MNEALFFEPVFKERIWGGTKLHDYFGYLLPNHKIGEDWAISAHPNGPSIVKNGMYQGKTLIDLWQKNPELFGHPTEETFPLLTKILDANTDLSVQVHPDDNYAKKHENGELGKTECWYIIDCEPGAELIYGHNAKTKEEFERLADEGNWDKLLRKVKIKPGEFYYVPSGTIHALGTGTLVLETQQNSDTTYRVYDYDRKDASGNKRELHLKKAIDVTTIPHQDASLKSKINKLDGFTETVFVENQFFCVYKWAITQKATLKQKADYTLVSILKGKGTLIIENNRTSIQKGDHFLIPNTVSSFTISGEVTAISSTPRIKN